MTLHRIELPRHEHSFIGTWHIYAMEMWDADYFNMEVQAFIQIRPSGGLDGYVERIGPKQRFVFT